MDRKLLNTLLVGAAAGVALGLWKASRKRYEFAAKVVAITGGSRGLGLVMARRFVDLGARVAICARDEGELQRAEQELVERGGDVLAHQCDLMDPEQARGFVEECRIRFGGIDVLVNNAGIIQVGPLEEQTEKDFRDAMDIHFWGPYHTMQAAIPLMKRRGEGRIANIVSIGGKVAVPHLVPYCASKFALSGMSKGFGYELAKDGIKVTTIYPGLMRTGSHLNAMFKGQNEREFALFSLMDGTPLTSINVERAAAQIIEAIALGRSELVITTQAKLAAKANELFPETVGSMMKLTTSMLPGEGGIGERLATGLESRSDLVPDFITAAIDREAEENNELKPGEALA
jgi:NAD(P)-dependent dehydrogenase (short-subunit alcohol dehydrogenase family)